MPLNIKSADFFKVKQNVSGIIYGFSGAGKSPALGTLPNVLYLDLENSTRYFTNHGLNPDIAHIESWKELQDAYTEVVNSPYDYVVVDSLSAATDMLIEQLKIEDARLFTKNGMPTLQCYGILDSRLQKFMQTYMTIPGKNIILVAHASDTMIDEKEKTIPMIRGKKVDKFLRQPYMSFCGFMERPRKLVFRPSETLYIKDATGKLAPNIYVAETFNMHEIFQSITNPSPEKK
jgi:hypothetical protein